MRLLHLHWPHLPLALMQARASASFPTGPTILGGQPWMPGTVIDASPEARALGVRRGMALGAAHRLAPEAVFLDPEPDADATAIETAFERLAAFSPGVAGTADPHDPAFGLFEVQVDGLGPLWGAEPVLVQRIGGALERERDEQHGTDDLHPRRDLEAAEPPAGERAGHVHRPPRQRGAEPGEEPERDGHRGSLSTGPAHQRHVPPYATGRPGTPCYTRPRPVGM